MADQYWFSVRSVFRSDTIKDGKPRRFFEERVVLFRAGSPEEALAKGEAEAKRCAADLPGVLLNHLVADELPGDDPREGDEVWSCVRDLDVSDDQFLRQVYQGEIESFTNIHSNRDA
jgi:hypothetical protein